MVCLGQILPATITLVVDVTEVTTASEQLKLTVRSCGTRLPGSAVQGNIAIHQRVVSLTPGHDTQPCIGVKLAAD